MNALLEALELDGCTLPEEAACGEEELSQVLDALLDDAYARGVLKENSIVYRDLFDTKLMGALTPRPAQVIEKFQALDYLLNGGDNNVFNLGNGVGFTVKEVVDVARAVTGHPIPAKIAPRRAGDPAQLIASSEKAIQVLGWKPKYNDLNTIVASAWAWHKSHPHGFEEG